jgi:hypothetical protein
MKFTVNKLLIGLATTTAILAPLAPKNVNINITLEAQSTGVKKPEPKYSVVQTKCDLVNKTTTVQGMQVCEYKCRAGDKITIYKTYRSNAAFCKETIDENIKKTERSK